MGSRLKLFGYACISAALLLALYASGSIISSPLRAAPAAASVAAATFDPSAATTTPGYYSIVRVIDGDTFVVWDKGEEVTVRVMGIDTPETHDPRKPVECFGPEAAAEGTKLLTGQDVRLVPDPTQDRYDKYGRMLAYVYLPNGLFYNEFMIENGFAHEYTFKKAYEFQKEFRAAQAAAKKAGLGFWSAGTCGGNTGINSHAATSTPMQ